MIICNSFSQKVLDKILEPFLTKTSTGKGTGSGLGYDILTKGLGGELKMETLTHIDAVLSPGGNDLLAIEPGTTFIIQIANQTT